jgi:hypothetical protein
MISEQLRQRTGQAGSAMHRASVAAALVLIGACACAQAETGPCKPDQFNGLTCGEGPGAARPLSIRKSNEKN